MSNTKQRIISAVVMILIFITSLYFGKVGYQLLLLITGGLLVDEITTNLVASNRLRPSYLIAISTYIIAYLFFIFVENSIIYINEILNLGIIINLIFMGYLFFNKMDSKKLTLFFKKFSFLLGIIFLIPILCLSYISFSSNWIEIIGLLFILNFSVDTGAWYFGRKYGNKKLWPAISPKKTINGSLGGIIVGVSLSTLYTFYIFGKINLFIIIGFILLSILAQLGDLVESKIKRQFAVKDSSNLIPGHGGIYDRLDSLIFVSPFFILFIKNLL